MDTKVIPLSDLQADTEEILQSVLRLWVNPSSSNCPIVGWSRSNRWNRTTTLQTT